MAKSFLDAAALFDRDSGKNAQATPDLRCTPAGAPWPLHDRISYGASQPNLAQLYLRLWAAGKPAKVALIVTTRKLLIALNSALEPELNFA